MKKLSLVIGLLVVLSAILGAVSCARRQSTESPAADSAAYEIQKDRPDENFLVMDFSRLTRPSGLEEFTPLFHLPPV